MIRRFETANRSVSNSFHQEFSMRLGLREMIFILLLLAMPVAAYFFVFQPRNHQIARARQEIAVKQQKLAQLETATMKIKDLGTEIDKLSDAINVFEEKLPAERETEVILKEVWELATRHHLIPKSVRTDKTIDGPLYSTLPIQMSISGDFDGFYSFLLDLEKLQRLTQIPRLELQKINTEEGQMKADFVLYIFFESQPDAAAHASAGSDRL
jgi:Tfp pilus assembly protein PilO